MNATKRWVVAWGFDDGRILFYYTGNPLEEDEADCGETEIAVADHFHATAIDEVKSGKQPYLALSPGDQSYREVDGAISSLS